MIGVALRDGGRHGSRAGDDPEVLRALGAYAGDPARHAMGRHAHSFSFAARFMGRSEREAVQDVYAFCRATDDLVDRPPAGVGPAALLDGWESAARRAWGGQRTGLAVVDDAMAVARAADVPFERIGDLIEGMRMDLRGASYATLDDLDLYAYRVAGVVGVWLAHVHGVRDPAVLGRADALGRAMQLTNILRDVGEDLRRGRLYLPRRLLAEHGVTVSALLAGLGGGPLPHGYAAIVESLMAVADGLYREGLRGIPALPRGFGRSVRIAAHVYRGIHAEIRANGYDNLRRRATTSLPRKVVLATRALLTAPAPAR